MIIKHQIDWAPIPGSIRTLKEAEEIFPSVTGNLQITMPGGSVDLQNCNIILAILPIINMLSRSVIVEFKQRVLPVSLGDEPELFLIYDKSIDVYAYNPKIHIGKNNPIIDSIEYSQAATLRDNISRSFIAELSSVSLLLSEALVKMFI